MSGATARRCSLSPAKTPELGNSGRGRAHPRRQAGHSRGSRPSALPGSLPKFVNSEGGGRAPGSERERRGKGGVITHRRRRRGRRRRAARCRAWPAGGGPACWGTCWGTCWRNAARDWGSSGADRDSHSYSWTGINQAALRLPLASVLRPGPLEADSGRDSTARSEEGTQGSEPPNSSPATPTILIGAWDQAPVLNRLAREELRWSCLVSSSFS